MAANRVPGSDEPLVEVMEDGIRVLAQWEKLPEGIRAFMLSAYRDLQAAAFRLLRFIRWRWGLRDVDRVSEEEFSWSYDGEVWHLLPTPLDPDTLQWRRSSESAADRSR